MLFVDFVMSFLGILNRGFWLLLAEEFHGQPKKKCSKPIILGLLLRHQPLELDLSMVKRSMHPSRASFPWYSPCVFIFFRNWENGVWLGEGGGDYTTTNTT